VPASCPSLREISALALVCLASGLAGAHARAADRYEGRAHVDGALAYSETHWRYREQGRPARLVLYRCADGTAFARKRMRVVGRAASPDFDFEDARDGYREGVRSTGDGREVYWQARRDAPMKSRALSVGADSIIDAGFDAMVRERLAALASGKRVEAEFLLPSRLDFIDVAIARDDSADVAGGTLPLRMNIDAWYGFAAPGTRMLYRRSDGWLLRFDGIGTIRDARGRHQRVRVEFPPERHVPSVDRAEIEAAAALPLRGCGG
jgi:hypothetical protein